MTICPSSSLVRSIGILAWIQFFTVRLCIVDAFILPHVSFQTLTNTPFHQTQYPNQPFQINHNQKPRLFESKQSLLYEKPPLSVDTRIQVSMDSLELNPDELRNLTLLRILVPSILYALVTFAIFPTLVHTLTEAIRTSFDGLAAPNFYGPATLNLILTDNSNQFIQNIHTFCGLLFSLLMAHTFSFLIKQQETLYNALYEELSTIQSLLEQIALVSEGRPQFYQTLLYCVYDYLERDLLLAMNSVTRIQDASLLKPGLHKDSNPNHFYRVMSSITGSSLKDYDDLPARMISTRPMEDSLETILYLTSVGEPSHIYSTLRSLRQARAKRLGALQQKMPDIQMSLLNVFGLMVLCTFPVIATGSQTVGGEALIQVQRIHLSVGAFALGCVLGIIHELRRPGTGSAYNVDYTVLQNLLRGLHLELQKRLLKCRLDLESDTDDINKTTQNIDDKESNIETEIEPHAVFEDRPWHRHDSISSIDSKQREKSRPWLAKSVWKRIRSLSQRPKEVT